MTDNTTPTTSPNAARSPFAKPRVLIHGTPIIAYFYFFHSLLPNSEVCPFLIDKVEVVSIV